MRIRPLLYIATMLLTACNPAKTRIYATEHDTPEKIADRAAAEFCPKDPTYAARFKAANTANLDPSNWSMVIPPKWGIEVTPVECRPAEAKKAAPAAATGAVNPPATATGAAKPPTAATGAVTPPTVPTENKKPDVPSQPRADKPASQRPAAENGNTSKGPGKNPTPAVKPEPPTQPAEEGGGDITE